MVFFLKNKKIKYRDYYVLLDIKIREIFCRIDICIFILVVFCVKILNFLKIYKV